MHHKLLTGLILSTLCHATYAGSLSLNVRDIRPDIHAEIVEFKDKNGQPAKVALPDFDKFTKNVAVDYFKNEAVTHDIAVLENITQLNMYFNEPYMGGIDFICEIKVSGKINDKSFELTSFNGQPFEYGPGLIEQFKKELNLNDFLAGCVKKHSSDLLKLIKAQDAELSSLQKEDNSDQ